jgi:hypothetical protein
VNLKSYIITISSLSAALLFVSCGQKSVVPEADPAPIVSMPPFPSPPKPKAPETPIRKEAQKFLEITKLGTLVIKDLNYNLAFKGLDRNKQLFIAKVDNLTIGEQISGLDQWDIAFENGLIKGLLDKNFKVSEKLDYIKIREVSEYLDTNPEQGFYMHSIDIDSHEIIKNKYDSPFLFEYQVVEFSIENSSIIVYIRIVDLSSLKILSSALIKSGNNVDSLLTPNIKLHDKIYSSVKSFRFPDGLFNNLSEAAILDIDILNISGKYNLRPSEKLMAIENAITSGISDNPDYKKVSLIEKTSGFNFKFPSVYENIVFNTNPILYEEWSEFIRKTKCKQLIMYRYIEDEGIYFRVLDASQNGKILGSFFIPIENRLVSGETPVIDLFEKVKKKMTKTINFEKFQNKKIILVDGDKHPTESASYSQNLKKYDEMQFAIEEGILSSILSNAATYNIQAIEKLKTLYLKRPYMYENKVFNLNPIYLDDWSQLKDFGVDVILVYNNLIPYYEIDRSSDDIYEIAVSFRIIDLNTGSIIQVGEISN